jgi:endonuclease/exonuclease/phosphatase family metal-dependent hydrolase
MNNSIRVATYNLRYANNKDTGNLWVDRSPVVINLIRFHEFDILGTQEGLKGPLNDISSALPYFDRYGVGRDDGSASGEHCAIFFQRNRFTLINAGNFWLSETPERPAFGWDARHNRICTWVELKSTDTIDPIFVFNAHFDHHGVIARTESSRLVLQQMEKIAGKNHCILMGDLNSDHNTDAYRILAASGRLKDTLLQVEHPYVNNPSFNSWGQASEENRLIDHIFVSENFDVLKYGILTDTYFSKMPSDHFPVMADIVLRS